MHWHWRESIGNGFSTWISHQDSEQAIECLSTLNALAAIYRNRDNQSLKSAALAVAFYYKFPTFDSEREGGFSAKRDMSSRSGRLYSGRQGGGRSDSGQAWLTTPTTARAPAGALTPSSTTCSAQDQHCERTSQANNRLTKFPNLRRRARRGVSIWLGRSKPNRLETGRVNHTGIHASVLLGRRAWNRR